MSILALPGDHIPIPSTSSVKLGPGLAISSNKEGQEEELVSVAPGILGQLRSVQKGKAKHLSDQQAFWIESNSDRYYPFLHDHVLCQITNRGVDAYQVTLFNTFTTANLPALSFEGATKRNKPNLRIGTLLYAQIVSAQKHAEIELTCVDPSTGKSNGFGELKSEREDTNLASKKGQKTIPSSSANLFSISCGLARSLLNDKHPLLARLATHFPFEVAIGVNGMVWVKAEEVKHVIAVGKVLEASDAKGRFMPTPIAIQAANGTLEEGEEDKTALELVRQRGALSVHEIAQIVDSFK